MIEEVTRVTYRVGGMYARHGTRLAKVIPEAVDTLTPDGRMPTDDDLRQRFSPAA